MSAALTFAHYGDERELKLTDDEKVLASIALSAAVDAGIPSDKLAIVRKSDSYTTIVVRCNEYDFDLLRFKMSPRAKWVAAPMTNDDSAANTDNPLFAAQKNKRQYYWKANVVNPEDVLQLIPFSLRSYETQKEVN